ncbi:gamma-glutamyl kinase (plasmid) [Paroceanicella profunda]|uniref:Gamma-glutamyl kinase n=1 Tax=Paroceanicella profunda TaxID=2579971 RepID=A0A5B8G6P2_9RHOB|nr:sulfotransferase family 2 domain-containing protein [Paroceanicella profunda]QDL94793.1 gamma-glutamyl kinase [Paroceanicella profunda]
MLAFFEPKIVVLAVPKTGTSALNRYLRKIADIAYIGVEGEKAGKHTSVSDFRGKVEPDLLKQGHGPFECVAAFREPVSWLNSWYRFRRRDSLDGKPQSTKDLTFDEFVQAFCLPDRKKPLCANLKPQSWFVCDKAGAIAVDHLFKYELENREISKFLADRLNVEIKLDQVNVSPVRTGFDLSEKTLRLYRRAFASDFEIYDSL